MESSVTEAIASINGFVWGPFMLALYLLAGLLFTLRTKFFQISRFGLWMKTALLSSLSSRAAALSGGKRALSQIQSLCVALAGTIGVGKIMGVATAIIAGGPGAVFWMWIAALFGMMTKYAEITLGMKYRAKNEKGEWIGGAMFYIERGLGLRWMAVLFSLLCAISVLGIGGMVQSNALSEALENSFGVPPIVSAFVIAVVAAVVILGGIKRIATVAEKLVPFMAVFYMVGGLVVILANARQVPAALSLIFTEAFNFRAAGGGVLGYGILSAMQRGISRGVFSNEAGLGTSVMAHSASETKEPAEQGMCGIFEVFVDTIVICSITALTILVSGVYDMGAYLSGAANTSAAALASESFASVLPLGDKFVAVAISLFAFSSTLGQSCYGDRAIEHLFGSKAVMPYRLLLIAMVFVGCMTSAELVWVIADTLTGLMAMPNLVAILLLNGQVAAMTKTYMSTLKVGRNTV